MVTSCSNGIKSQLFDKKRVGRVKCDEEMLHQSGYEGIELRSHSITKHLQGVENAFHTAWHFLTIGQAIACRQQVFQENGQDVICVFVNIGLEILGKFFDCVESGITNVRLRMFDATADDLNKRCHVLGTNMLCTSFHHNC